MSQAIDYKCPQCGGSLGWDAAKGALVCANCGSMFDPAQFPGAEATPEATPGGTPGGTPGPGAGGPASASAVASAGLSAASGAALAQTARLQAQTVGWQPQTGAAQPQTGAAGWGAVATQIPATQPPQGPLPNLSEYTCNSCGAHVVADLTAAAGTCPYCRSPIVIAGQVSGDLAPDLVIPFRHTRDQAVEALRKLYLGKRLLPKVFSKQNFVDEVKGVYIPFWLFDFDTVVTETYSATNRHSRRSGSKEYVTTQEYLAKRQGQARFWGVPVDGSTNMPDAIMESIEPFDLSQAVQFQPGYLAGFLAERYDLDSSRAQARAKQRLDQSGGRVFPSTVRGYQTVHCVSASVSVKEARVHYALLPVWMLTTIWRGQRFTFAMNGQTGRMVGDLPLDRKAYWSWFAVLGGASAAVGALIGAVAGVVL